MIETTEKASTLNGAGYRWVAAQVDSQRTKWALIGLAILQAAVNIVVSGEVIRLYHQDAARPPIVVGVDPSGRAAVLSSGRVNELSYTAKEASIRYHLKEWTWMYYSRLHDQIAETQSEAFRFFHPDISSKLKDLGLKELEEFSKRTQADEIEVHVKNVIPHLDKEPYRAEIQFVKTVQRVDKTPIATENWTAEVRFTLMDRVPEKLHQYNPLGLLITYVHANKEF